MPAATRASTSASAPCKRLVLCFDGTGNTFSGSSEDTNVVKLYDKFDRDDPNQFHYYQTGIGTYDINGGSINKGFFGNLARSVSRGIDTGFGTSFDAHVMAGYKFVMKYYQPGDKIYMFGFSRGAFTARFLARMIHTVGLLSMGNDEMVPFAYELYQQYLLGKVKSLQSGSADSVKKDNAKPDAKNKLTAFSLTFCRQEHAADGSRENIKVHFLGLFDCVGSVAVLETTPPYPIPVTGTAEHVRHAVATDEFRVKFKAALLCQDIKDGEQEDIKEVWFPGNHGDVGGGWPAESAESDKEKPSFVTKFKKFFTGMFKDRIVTREGFQMSDIPLSWMIQEIEKVNALHDPEHAVKFNQERLADFNKKLKEKENQALTGRIHNPLAFGGGCSFMKVLFWKFSEVLPFITRYELRKGGWVNQRFPLNMSAARDIPTDAHLHRSLLWRLANQDAIQERWKRGYKPTNNHGERTAKCLVPKGDKTWSEYKEVESDNEDHKIFGFKGPMANGVH